MDAVSAIISPFQKVSKRPISNAVVFDRLDQIEAQLVEVRQTQVSIEAKLDVILGMLNARIAVES